ncbi:MAG: hypothetical protein DMG80_19195 [Acidobacteria bacterium]|nr:MAG: hypothetical protein DMG80_19195 [Acidobacteriota bacterium]
MEKNRPLFSSTFANRHAHRAALVRVPNALLAIRKQSVSSVKQPTGGDSSAVSRRLQLPIGIGLNLLMMPGEQVLWRDVADGAVQTNVVVSSR